MTGRWDNDMVCRRAGFEPKRLLRILEKTSVFRGLTLEQAQRLLGVCEILKYRAGEVLYKEGSPSTEMFMLLSGRLAVRKGGRTVLAEITPVDIVGEMGIVTGQVRSAQVVVLEDSMGLSIRKDRLDTLLKPDADLDRKISKNIIGILCHKIREDGVRLDAYEHTVAHLKKRIPALSDGNERGAASPETETVLDARPAVPAPQRGTHTAPAQRTR